MKPILHYVQKLNLTLSQMEQSDIDAILEAGWNEKPVIHANLICALFNLINRLVEGLGIQPDLKLLNAMAENRYQHGYLFILEMLN